MSVDDPVRGCPPRVAAPVTAAPVNAVPVIAVPVIAVPVNAAPVLAVPVAAAPARAPWRSVAPAIAMMAWGGNHFTPLLLMYRHVEGYSQLQVDMFLAFYLVGLVPGFLGLGALSDRFGRKPMLWLGLVAGCVASAVLALGADVAVWMCVGRTISGLSVAAAMVVGTSCVEELSRPPFDDAAISSAARRASLSLTVGFGLGAGIAGALAQWGPAPTVTPYLLQIGLSLLAAIPLARAPESRPAGIAPRSLRADLRLPPAVRPRFAGVVVPLAPWVFAAAGIGYAVLPSLVSARVGGDPVAFAALLCVVLLGSGAGVQPFVARIAAATGGRSALVGLALMTAGMVLSVVDAEVLSVPLTVVTGVVLGVAFGICLVSGLVEVRTLADPEELGGTTGIFYSLAYLGFLLPMVLAALATVVPYPVLLAALAALSAGCGVTVARGLRSGRAGLAGSAPR